MGKYDDIINLPHYKNPNRIPMPIENRAAQFAPFAALSGHEDAISETARITQEKLEPSEIEKEKISFVLNMAYKEHHPVKIIYFQKDKTKSGGSYLTIEGYILKIDETEKIIETSDGSKIRVPDIISAVRIR